MTNAIEMSRRTILATGKNKLGATVTLVHRTAGDAVAGSGTTPVEEAWGALWEREDGTRGGHWYRTEAEARARFNAVNVDRFAQLLSEFPDYPVESLPDFPPIGRIPAGIITLRHHSRRPTAVRYSSIMPSRPIGNIPMGSDSLCKRPTLPRVAAR